MSSARGPRGVVVARLLLRFQRDPLTAMVHAAQTYGDVARFDLPGQAIFLLRGPETARHVLISHQDRYGGDGHNPIMREVLGEGLLTAQGDTWARHRRLVQPLFAARRLGGYAGHMTAAAEGVLATWSPGRRDICAAMSGLTLEVAGRALFGVELSADAPRVGRALDVIVRVIAEVARSPRALLLARAPGVGPERAWRLQFMRRRGLQAAVAELDAVVWGIMDRSRQGGGDLLGQLVDAGLARGEVRDEILTFLVAGHETTAAALTWMWHLLARNPQARLRLTEEIRDVLGGRTPEASDVDRLPWTRAVVSEAIRLYPPAWIINRMALRDDEIAGHRVPAGALVLISPYLNHRDPRWWNAPERFDPSRFLPGADAGRPRLAYLPFGGGRRMCVGAGWAMMEAVLLTAMIMQRFGIDADPAARPVAPEPHATLRPGGGLTMVIRSGSGRPAVAGPGRAR